MYELLGLIALVVLAVQIWRRRGRTPDESWLPRELRGATVRFAERTFRARLPFGLLVVRIDRAYQEGATLHLVEFKTRGYDRVHKADVIELSAQKLAIEQGERLEVAPVGHVVIERAGAGAPQRTAHRVQLLTEAQVVALAQRRAAILAGQVEPAYADTPNYCRKCQWLAECKPHLRGTGGEVKLAGKSAGGWCGDR